MMVLIRSVNPFGAWSATSAESGTATTMHSSNANISLVKRMFFWTSRMRFGKLPSQYERGGVNAASRPGDCAGTKNLYREMIDIRLLFANNWGGGAAHDGTHPPPEAGVRLHLEFCRQKWLLAVLRGDRRRDGPELAGHGPQAHQQPRGQT